MGEPAMFNTHAHLEQPQPQKSCRSTHTNSRRIASMEFLMSREFAEHRQLNIVRVEELLGISDFFSYGK
jgi:hypothetical protein